MQPASPLTCAACGYDLSGSPIVNNQITCPECGGHRVRMPRWWEPRSTRRAALALAGLALLGALPVGGALGLLAPIDGASDLAFALTASTPPFVLLAILFWVWRPSAPVGVVVAGATSVSALVVVLYGLTVGFLCMPVGVVTILMYYLTPIPAGVLLARTAFRTGS